MTTSPKSRSIPGEDKHGTVGRSQSSTTVGYPHLFRLLHWVLGVSLVVLVLTGLSLHAVARPGWPLFPNVLPWFLWPGRAHVIHFSAAVAFFPSVLAVLWLYWRRRSRFRVTHVLLLGGGLAMVLSALVLLNPFGPTAVYTIARLIHAVTGLVVLPIALICHVVKGLTRLWRLLVPAFHPWARPSGKQLACFLPLALLTTCLILHALPLPRRWRELVARRIPTVDGKGSDIAALPWNEARPLWIEVANGVGHHGGRARVTLRALHDGRELFVLAEWPDLAEDRRCLPWKKTDEGWRRLVTDEKDESVYYEDKFSLIFPTVPDWGFDRFGCAFYCHAGGGLPYGYKGSDRLVDVWHWKATRTDPVGQVDDKYWWEIDFSAKDIGRHGDPKEGGGYTANTSPEKTHPAFLPDGPLAIKRGAILKEHGVEYSPEAAARIAAGTIIPGIVVSPFQGDRGDVRCRSQYEGGRWRLFIRRKLDTGSERDVRFVPGHKHSFGCAVFDHTSNRHAYKFSPYRLVLEE